MNQAPGEMELLRAFLIDRDVECPACRHNVRGAGGPVCPECGVRLMLRVATRDVRHRWWAATMLAFALPLGFALTLAAAGTWAAMRGMLIDHREWMTLGTAWLAAVVCSMAVIVLIRRRWKFVERRAVAQRAIALSAIAAMLLAHASLLTYFARIEPF